MMDRRTGTDGKTYGIRFAIALPENWTGQYLQQGGGGLNGTVARTDRSPSSREINRRWLGALPLPPPIRAIRVQAAVSMVPSCRISRPRSTSSTSPMAGWPCWHDRSSRTTTARPPAHSYFVGCSTGGREAMLMTQRYPLYFDGIVAGAPAMRTGHSNLATRTVTVNLNRIAPKGPDGRLIPGGATLRWRSQSNHRQASRCLRCARRRERRHDLRCDRLQFQTCRSSMSGSKDGRLSLQGTSRCDPNRVCRSERFARQSGLSRVLLRHGNHRNRWRHSRLARFRQQSAGTAHAQPFNRISMLKPQE